MKKCGLWCCSNVIPDDWTLCSLHFPAFRDRQLIDQCCCGRFKEVKYPKCPICYLADLTPEYSKDWEKSDKTKKRFFVYMLELDGGESIYIGQTNDLNKRISQHKNNKVPHTANRNPLLCYVRVFSSREEATKQEAELKAIHLINPSQIRRMIADELSAFLASKGLDSLTVPPKALDKTSSCPEK